MYVPFGSACDQPNSETPMTQARIDAQNRRVARVGRHFEKGNADMAAIVNGLTPPPPSGTCNDLTNSRSMFAAQTMAAPLPPAFCLGAPLLGMWARAPAVASRCRACRSGLSPAAALLIRGVRSKARPERSCRRGHVNP